MNPIIKWLVLFRVLLVVAASGILFSTMACSGAGDAANVAAGAGASLTDTKTSVQIPTGSFDADVTVAVTENKVDLSGLGNVKVISTPVTLEFSQARIVRSDDPIDVKIQLDTEKMRQALLDGNGIYAKVRVKGEQITYDRGAGADETWLPLLGELDSDLGTLTVKLFGTASEIEIVAVAGTELKILALDPVSFAKSKIVKRKTKAINRVGMAQNPWAIVCDTAVLSDHGVASCDASNPNSLVIKTQNALTDASKDLNTRLQMNVLVIQQLSALSLAQTNLSSSPDPAILRKYDPSVKYNMAYLSTGCNGTTRSCYNGVTGVMTVAEITFDAGLDQIIGSTLHHELVHAVQTAVMISNIDLDAPLKTSRNTAIIEGAAQAVGFLAASGWNAAASKGRVLNGSPRNWADPLGKYTPYDDTYFMTEFFSLANGGDLTYLMPLFHSFNGAAGWFHKRLDVASQSALGDTLPNIFLKRVMPARSSSSPNRVHYRQEDVTNNDVDHSFAATLPSMASHQYIFSDASNGDICINVNLFQGADPNLALVMLNGTEGGDALSLENDATARMTTVGDVLTVNGHVADVQVVNLSTGGLADSKNYTIAAYTDGACLPPAPQGPCNPMKVMCDEHGCGLYVQDFAGRCWARAASCDAQGRCLRSGVEGGFDFGNCDNLRQQMTANIPVGNDVRDDPATLPDDRQCGNVDLGCRWMVLCPR